MATVGDHRPPIDKAAAAAYLGVSERYVQRLVQDRRLRHLKFGRKVMFRPGDLDAFIEAAVREPRSIHLPRARVRHDP